MAECVAATEPSCLPFQGSFQEVLSTSRSMCPQVGCWLTTARQAPSSSAQLTFSGGNSLGREAETIDIYFHSSRDDNWRCRCWLILVLVRAVLITGRGPPCLVIIEQKNHFSVLLLIKLLIPSWGPPTSWAHLSLITPKGPIPRHQHSEAGALTSAWNGTQFMPQSS